MTAPELKNDYKRKNGASGETKKGVNLMEFVQVLIPHKPKILTEVYEDHKEKKLQWERGAPAELVRTYLTNIESLKRLECVHLLALKNIPFPVDVNVYRIVIRLGWVPIQPLEDAQIHIEMPVMDNIQKEIWPTLKKLTPQGYKSIIEEPASPEKPLSKQEYVERDNEDSFIDKANFDAVQ